MNSSTREAFTTASFAIAASKTVGGIHLDESMICRQGSMRWRRSCSCRARSSEAEDPSRFINRLEDGKTETLLMDVNRSNEV
ncbi:hypothetical protein [Mesorhizobium sp. P5_C1]